MRPFVPRSDDEDGDGDNEMPPIADDDTPPPPDRPLIRQGLAFGASAFGTIGTPSIIPAATTIETYQAKLPEPTKATIYLPGQAPVQPPPPKRKRKKKNEEFKAQSGRFRLEAYSPAPTPAPMVQPPPVMHAEGSYATMFRGVPQYPQYPRFDSPVASSGTLTDTNTIPVPTPPRKSKPKKTGESKKKAAPVPAVAMTQPVPHAQHVPPSSSPVRTSMSEVQPTPPPGSGRSYYRHDYDAGKPKEQNAVVTSSSSHHTEGHAIHSDPPRSPKHSRRPLRMVTVLVQDIRSGITDYQLVEVMVPLKPHEHPEDGFWADAEHIIDKWQKSPARVDGPARVYTLRGKYRQILLRVSASNEDDYSSMNVLIAPDRTINVVVEPLPMSGTLPPPPKIPPDLLPAEWDSSHEPADNPEPVSETALVTTRQHSPFPDSDTLDGDVTVTKHQTSLSPPASSHRVVESSEPAGTSARVIEPSRGTVVTRPLPRRGYETPDSDAEPDEVDKAICKATSQLLLKDPGWKEYFKFRGRPASVPNMLHQYRFVKRLMDEFAGMTAPFQSRHFLIEEKHIIGGLHIEDEDGKFASSCKETLGLLELYGPGGKCYENPEVVKLVNNNDPPEYNAKPIKRLLHLLRDVDKKWKEENPEVEQASSERDGDGSDTSESPNS
ncbi:hypothetical protein CC1G_14169 [Coprinopsis cinerea okayama7|uniref:Uncharacterized protein n=1 Tax=Coprinopsis cinerea (strain Okayama-7 / 130 / ATCC MYA-4618 / FGSC 9003) TaxID=240176 RepID=D6RL70_COPC7|nr:hypothetical protein CC1G_14169 [Coprinopsis cinerea okayama7\|eukprot:XP_002911636.1 hypothetical protein CC1G_14169 [Coprinopsis cinerea okayama7\